MTATDNISDGGIAASVDGSGVAFGGLVSGDNLILASLSGTFSDTNAAAGKTVTLVSTERWCGCGQLYD